LVVFFVETASTCVLDAGLPPRHLLLPCLVRMTTPRGCPAPSPSSSSSLVRPLPSPVFSERAPETTAMATALAHRRMPPQAPVGCSEAPPRHPHSPRRRNRGPVPRITVGVAVFPHRTRAPPPPIRHRRPSSGQDNFPGELRVSIRSGGTPSRAPFCALAPPPPGHRRPPVPERMVGLGL
jgi:hypothetical protein